MHLSPTSRCPLPPTHVMPAGCPIDVICSKGAGSALLLRPRRLEEVVRAVTGCIDKPVIVKLRWAGLGGGEWVWGVRGGVGVTVTDIQNAAQQLGACRVLLGEGGRESFVSSTSWMMLVTHALGGKGG
jgi:hypothetical protein